MPTWSWSPTVGCRAKEGMQLMHDITMTFTHPEKSNYKNTFLHHKFCRTCPRWAQSWNVNMLSFMYNGRDNTFMYWDNPTVQLFLIWKPAKVLRLCSKTLPFSLLPPVVGRWITVSPAGFTLSWQTPSPPTQRDQPQNEHHLRVRSHHLRLTGVVGERKFHLWICPLCL